MPSHFALGINIYEAPSLRAFTRETGPNFSSRGTTLIVTFVTTLYDQ